MEFIAPIPFADAVAKLGDQSVIGATFDSSEWSDVPVELRDNAFFSSRIESARVLQRAQDALGDFLAGNQKTADNGELMLATGSRAAFVGAMREFLAEEGVTRTTGDLHDITSEQRLGLIFDIKTRQAQDYGYWKQGMDPDILNEFPAQRFIRVRDVKEPRELHERFQNQVYLKTDPIWWLEINKDFGTPYGPWGWGCGHDVEDVDRDEAEQLGLLKPGEKLNLAPLKKFLGLNRTLQASIKTLPPELLQKLLDAFGEQVVLDADAGTLRWRGQPAGVPGAPLTDAERLALVQYTKASYMQINRGLRTGSQDNYVNNQADLITQALSKLNPYAGKVERGDTLTSEQLDPYQTGNVVTVKQFWSASRTLPFPGNVRFTIDSTDGRRVARYSPHKAETEVLFDQGSMFRVLSRAFVDGVWQISLEEL